MLRPAEKHSDFSIAELQQRGPVKLLALHGRLDGRAAQLLQQRCTQMRGPGFEHVALDLSQVTFLASSGLGVFLAETEARQEAGGSLYLVAPSQVVATVIRLLNVDRFLTMVPSLDVVLSSISA